MVRRERILVLLLIVIVGLLVITAVNPYDRGTWHMEVTPVPVALPVLTLTYRRFPLTSLLGAGRRGARKADEKLQAVWLIIRKY